MPRLRGLTYWLCGKCIRRQLCPGAERCRCHYLLFRAYRFCANQDHHCASGSSNLPRQGSSCPHSEVHSFNQRTRIAHQIYCTLVSFLECLLFNLPSLLWESPLLVQAQVPFTEGCSLIAEILEVLGQEGLILRHSIGILGPDHCVGEAISKHVPPCLKCSSTYRYQFVRYCTPEGRHTA